VSLTAPIAWVRSNVHASLLVQAAEHAPNETGGILLGYRVSPAEIVITDAIGPGPDADHRRTGFDPDADWQAAELARRYDATNRRVHYLGDWHTHPGGTSTLSRTDRRTLREIARHRDARCPHPVMAVLAGGEPWILIIHQQAPRPLRRTKLEQFAVRIY
jgi:integrative and conjugative element protein (TIGR02256 family)